MISQVLNMISNSSGFVMGIMILLFLFSLISWSLFFERLFFYNSTSKDIKSFNSIYNGIDSATEFIKKLRYKEFINFKFLSTSFEQITLKDIGNKKNFIVKKLENGLNDSIENLYNRLEYLSMITTISPFLGLLGTVWGIMKAFIDIGSTGEASLAVVAPGIAEALITTVAGLVVAIPSAIFFSYFSRKAKQKEAELINIFNSIEGLIGHEGK